jgi:hypothetical protein
MDPSLQALRRITRDQPDSASAARQLLERRAEFLLPLRAAHAELQASALDRYVDAFDSLELSILLCRSLATFFEGSLPPRSRTAEEALENLGELALLDLFRSGILVAGEVLVLMRSGFETGALARWRALHETTTCAEFISAGGYDLLETARRYLQRVEFRTARKAGIWQGWMRKVDPDRALPREFWKEWAAEAEAIVDEHGGIIRSDYGWAHNQLLAMSPDYAHRFEHGSRLRGPIFDDLEGVVRKERQDALRWQFLYADANAAVHGSPSATLGFDEQAGSFSRMGPHLGEIGRVGEATAHRLADLARAYLTPDYGVEESSPSPTDALNEALETITHLSDMAAAAFGATKPR